MRLKKTVLLGIAFPLLLVASFFVHADEANLPIPPSGVIGFEPAMMAPEYWIARTPAPNRVLLTPQQIDAMNAKSMAQDAFMHDLGKVGVSLSREQITSWVNEASAQVGKSLVDAKGKPIPESAFAEARANAGLDGLPASMPTRYGLAVRRAQLRTLPTTMLTYPRKDLLDYEGLQGGTLFPGEPVIVAQASVDGKWLLVYCTQGPLWVANADIAIGSKEQVFAYANKKPYRVITGDKVNTVFTPETPELSELQLDMGMRVPLAQLPESDEVNGQVPYVSWAVELPVRRADGSLVIEPALLQRQKDTAADYLPLTRANIIRQSFKFLGERYGWGHLYNARDCSGFTSDVYHSMGILMSPYTGAQGQDPAFKHRVFTAADTHEARVKAVKEAHVGDLVVVPGHVLMILGQVNGQPYVIQDVPYAVFRDPSGKTRMTKVNGVSVTPLLPLYADDQHTYVDAMTSLVHVTAQ